MKKYAGLHCNDVEVRIKSLAITIRYDILDETGFNGSAILDDMQMSYMSLDDFKNLNDVEKRSTVYNYVNTNKKEKNKPKSLIDEWQERDKKAKLGKDAKEEELNKLKPSDYLFMMDWTEDSVDTQQPDVKVYPTEKIAAKYYNQAGDPGDQSTASAEKSVQIGVSDKVYNTIASGEWVDTREQDDSIQTNKYTSLDFYFEKFNMNRTGYEYDNGIKGNIGLTAEQIAGGTIIGADGSVNNGDISDSINGSATDIRNKIVEMATKIVKDHTDRKIASYSSSTRTIRYDEPKKVSGTIGGISNPTVYDCSSLVSCAYFYAGLKSVYGGGCSGGSLVAGATAKDGWTMWPCNSSTISKAKPGDIVMRATFKVDQSDLTKSNMSKPGKVEHAMIYIGNGQIAHASGYPIEWPKALRIESIEKATGYSAGKVFFLRPWDLAEADKRSASTNNSNSVNEAAGTVDGIKYVAKLGKARCTEYGPWDGSGTKTASGKSWTQVVNRGAASHNLPYGTKVYIPRLKGKVNNDGIFEVVDTGGHCFDFDIATSRSFGVTGFYEAYVISYGSGSIAASFTKMYNYLQSHGGASKYNAAFRDYMKYGGCLIKFDKFNSEDAKATWWK